MSGSRVSGFGDADGSGEGPTGGDPYRPDREVGFRSRGGGVGGVRAAAPVARSAGPRPRPRLRLGRIAVLVGAVGTTLAVAAAAIAMPEPEAPAAADTTVATPSASTPSASTAPAPSPSVAATRATPSPTPAPKAKAVLPPEDSGSGRRIVFDQSDQRVWLIEQDGTIDRTYLVSGSRFDNLDPGSYDVQSKQRHATSFDYTGTMEYFVRFTTGWSAPIGFHSIPVYNNGKPEQTLAELGTALSAGCVRQKKSDAKYLWDWAPVGTPVVVGA